MQDWEQLGNNQAWLALCRVFESARDNNRRALESSKVNIEQVRFLQGANGVINLILERDLRKYVEDRLEKENSKYGTDTGTDRGNRKKPR